MASAESDSYDLADAREEIEQARKNRGATAGLFVFSATTAPEGIQPFARYPSLPAYFCTSMSLRLEKKTSWIWLRQLDKVKLTLPLFPEVQMHIS